MALLHKKKPRGSGGPPSRQFYVEFLGCLPCAGIRGSIYTNGVAKELIEKKYYYPNVPKMTLQVSPNEIKISHENSDEHQQENITSVRYPCIMMKNITYATCMTAPHDDIATCIYYAFNRMTNCWLHTHVYRFDSPATAMTFIDLINTIVETPQHQNDISRIEQTLRNDGYLQPMVKNQPPPENYFQRPKSPPVENFAYEREHHVTPEMQSSMQLVTNELQQRLKLHEAPLLLPPKDYDTIHRKQGRLSDIASRKSLNEVLVGRASVDAAISASGNKLLVDEDRTTEQKKSPIYYPPKLPSNSGLNSPTSAQSPVILRRENEYRKKQKENHNSSFLSNSSGSSDKNYRKSYTPPSQSSPPPVTNRDHHSAYELYPPLKNPERSPVIGRNPDMHKRSSSHHTRESSMSSTHSGLSSHSDPFLIPNDADLDIPPDYDGVSRNANSIDRILKEGESLRHSEHFDNPRYYDQYRGHGNQVADIENVYPPHSPTSFPYDDNIDRLYAKPIKRTDPVQRRNNNLPY